MGLAIGDAAPDFTLKDQNGQSVTLSALWSRGPVVLYFYPKDFTLGCTAEACAFRDAYEDFLAAGASVVGVSSQGPESKKAFAEKHRLPFVLLSDEEGGVRSKYQVKGALFGLVDGRETYVIDRRGVVRHVFNSLVNATRHVQDALEVLKSLPGGQ